MSRAEGRFEKVLREQFPGEYGQNGTEDVLGAIVKDIRSRVAEHPRSWPAVWRRTMYQSAVRRVIGAARRQQPLLAEARGAGENRYSFSLGDGRAVVASDQEDGSFIWRVVAWPAESCERCPISTVTGNQVVCRATAKGCLSELAKAAMSCR